MNDDRLRPISFDKLVRCEACGELFLKTSFEGGLVMSIGLCQKCDEYFDGFQKFISALESEGKDE